MIPSRILNERNGFFGLTYFDCVLILAGTLQIHSYLLPYRKEWIAFLVAPAVATVLMSIRMKYRKGIIRDSIGFVLRERTLSREIR